LFLWIDLRRFLLKDDGNHSHDLNKGLLLRKTPGSAKYEEQEASIDKTCMKHGVSIARGTLFGTEELGWFRLTFTISEEEIAEGIRRLLNALEEFRVPS
jgi:bifunctional pyridoxal-dependent enzyme with beta-cystathionase and maltose regulon repressor activities